MMQVSPMPRLRWLVVCQLLMGTALAWVSNNPARHGRPLAFPRTTLQMATVPSIANSANTQEEKEQDILFDDFVDFLLTRQSEIIEQLEDLEKEHNSEAVFSKDTWGMFDDPDNEDVKPVGGITRVIQGGNVVEKGACSFTLIGQGILSKERAATIRSRQGASSNMEIHEGDEYAAAALSMVLHSRSPHVPTFRSDVRVFLVKPKSLGTNGGGASEGSQTPSAMAWFGGGADLTPYYLQEDDVQFFHKMYKDLCDEHWDDSEDEDDEDTVFSYTSMKKACDDYFYLPARQEHRGTGGIFFDDMDMTDNSLEFVKGVANAWMPSWIPIVKKRMDTPVSDEQKQWQMLRRGRYLEFNLLYDRGVKFGLANANPRVEGVMVSAPPTIAFEYNHPIVEGSPEAELMKVLKDPRDWA
mmetsp:Transcript_9883/g.20425  ORF Transcript_9883/g.20425 Transcript_9883/m.20425 type:complete len:412 (-) Transcript_9883:1727-2962(-)|eukprot:CAMPEP_0172470952 /NCGR_PEP_ID=MMETSP1065-20121228/67559_1 /TAXON_ID=265537 /ORGANISM="Amphiprora paludosa, Strain CCMP125" /LENGTH=411 /DNA_ID=CAMNT_0013229033 /DNA_START=98 /DNA_END=1333 /DNA_ORIENTATION=+